MRDFMRKERKSVAVVVLVVLCAVLAGGCGTSSNNNHGVSYTLVGFYDSVSTQNRIVGQVAPLSEAGAIEGAGTSFQSPGVSAGAVWAAPIVRNNLEGGATTVGDSANPATGTNPFTNAPFIQGERVFLSYYIAGAQVQPPDTSAPYSGIATGFGGESTADTMVVTPDVRTWMILNKGLLPELPFVMTATVRVRGTSSAGDTFFTNPVDFLIEWVPDIVIPPSSAAGVSAAESELDNLILE